MKNILLASAVMVSGLVLAPRAWAQQEAMAMFYQMEMAPRVCAWSDAASPAKITAAIAGQERALGVTAAQRTNLMRAAEADLRSDRANCAADGMLRMMYNEAVK
ncbi:hypothetical protein ACQW02_09960 [Humitalea sp. 24SJ18S-53]|uniref:hypothetical protein n=1 Tax=Humitalea sp. 24SJ18S-53 TaxID=3422307 RepID=UPI003D665BBF